jgi:hypothetical protein
MLVALLAACAGPTVAQPTPAAPAAPAGKKFDVKAFIGTYKGTWTNQATNATGPASIVINADETKKQATLTIDFDGPYLGLADPPAQTLTASYDDTMAKVTGNNPLFGDVNVTIDPDGNIIGVMKNLAGGIIPEMTYTGKVGGGKLDADYAVKFADGKTVNSILRLTSSKLSQ